MRSWPTTTTQQRNAFGWRASHATGAVDLSSYLHVFMSWFSAGEPLVGLWTEIKWLEVVLEKGGRGLYSRKTLSSHRKTKLYRQKKWKIMWSLAMVPRLVWVSSPGPAECGARRRQSAAWCRSPAACRRSAAGRSHSDWSHGHRRHCATFQASVEAGDRQFMTQKYFFNWCLLS